MPGVLLSAPVENGVAETVYNAPCQQQEPI